jgi:Glycosyl hydrolase catalytic core
MKSSTAANALAIFLVGASLHCGTSGGNNGAGSDGGRTTTSSGSALDAGGGDASASGSSSGGNNSSADGAADATGSTDATVAAEGGGTEGSAGADGMGPVDAAAHDSGVAADSGASMDSSATNDSGGVGVRTTCKRGVAVDPKNPPGVALAPTGTLPGVSWWYNWTADGAGGDSHMEFVPMVWDGTTYSQCCSGRVCDPRVPLPPNDYGGNCDPSLGHLHAAPPTGSFGYLLGFNEPNFYAQADMIYQQSAAAWPSFMATAKALGAKTVAPAMNFCGSPADPTLCSDPAVTDPVTYLNDFLKQCPGGCPVDHLSVHWYSYGSGCDLASLQGYLSLYAGFGKPIWLSEFSCDPSHSAADNKAFMLKAIPWLESNPNIFRYAWFSVPGGDTPAAVLQNADGSLTDLGKTYVGLPQTACH